MNAEGAARKPNIVFLLVDDMGWRDLACTGSPFYETPNIDRLAREGMLFTQAYAACPVCSPTRASILTGKYPASVGITDWIDWHGAIHPARGRLIDVPYLKELPHSERTLAHALDEAGYATWHVGKWHLGGPGSSPTDHGFERNVGGCEAGSPGRGGYFSPWTIPALRDVEVPPGTYLTDYLTDQAIELIRERDERPFYLNFWFYTVHTPIQAKPEKIRKYEEKARRMGLDGVQALVPGERFPCEHKRDQRVIRRVVQSDPVYAGMIESLDENVGRLLECLDQEGLTDNTLVVFTSDNGGLATAEGSPTCNAPLSEGKGWMYEGGTREPLLVRWPERVAAGSRCDVPVTSPDFFPTLLGVAGAAPLSGAPGEGVDLAPLLRGDGALEREAIFWHYPHYGNQGGTPGASVRMGRWKLIRFFEDERLELYDLDGDPGETRNQAATQPEVADRLLQQLRAWQEGIEAKIPAPNPDYKPYDRFA